jgi:hypothetical protein
MTQAEKQKKIFEAQPASTQKKMLLQQARPVDLDLEYFKELKETPIPQSAQCRDEEGNVFINERPITFEEAAIYKDVRQKAGQRLAKMRGDKRVRAVSKSKRATAVDAFMEIFSPETIKKRFTEFMKSVKSPPSYEEMLEALRKDQNGK